MNEVKCPVCQQAMEVYHGSNPHKQDSAFCHKCGSRRKIKNGKVVD